jgi:CBS domain containing-hemolysin-like protein
MSFVVDEYGGCIGLVTIEDLLEKIVGEIEDEYDKPEKLYEPYAEGGFLVEGNTETSVLNETLGWDLPGGDYETIAGLVIDRLEKIPHPGDQVLAGSYRLTVKDSSKRKIQSLIVRKIDDTEIDKEAIPMSRNSDI